MGENSITGMCERPAGRLSREEQNVEMKRGGECSFWAFLLKGVGV